MKNNVIGDEKYVPKVLVKAVTVLHGVAKRKEKLVLSVDISWVQCVVFCPLFEHSVDAATEGV